MGRFLVAAMEQIIEIPISEIRFYGKNRKEHFFSSDEKKIAELAESIERLGILEPLIVRKDPAGKAKYELIAGETRLRAAERVGIKTVPCIVRELKDFDAGRQYSDTNLYRDGLRMMERAYMLKSQRESWEDVIKETPSEVSERQTLKYIRLTELIPKMQALVDSRQISVDAGSLAFELTKEVQQMICDNIAGTKRALMPQAVKQLKQLCEEKSMVTPDDVEHIIMQTQPEKERCMTYRISRSMLRKLPEEYRKKSDFEKMVTQVCEMLAEGSLTLPENKKE